MKVVKKTLNHSTNLRYERQLRATGKLYIDLSWTKLVNIPSLVRCILHFDIERNCSVFKGINANETEQPVRLTFSCCCL